MRASGVWRGVQLPKRLPKQRVELGGLLAERSRTCAARFREDLEAFLVEQICRDDTTAEPTAGDKRPPMSGRVCVRVILFVLQVSLLVSEL